MGGWSSYVLGAEAHAPGVGVGDHHPHARVTEVAFPVKEHDRAVRALEHRVLHPQPAEEKINQGTWV